MRVFKVSSVGGGGSAVRFGYAMRTRKARS